MRRWHKRARRRRAAKFFEYDGQLGQTKTGTAERLGNVQPKPADRRGG